MNTMYMLTLKAFWREEPERSFPWVLSDVFQQRWIRDVLSNESAALEKRGQLRMHEKAPADPHSADIWRVERHEFLSHKLSGMQPDTKFLKMHDRSPFSSMNFPTSLHKA